VGVRADDSFSRSLDSVVGSWCWLSLEVTEKKQALVPDYPILCVVQSSKKRHNRCDISPGLTVSYRQQCWSRRGEVLCGFPGTQSPEERVKSKGAVAFGAGRASVCGQVGDFSSLSSVVSSRSHMCPCAVLLAGQDPEGMRCHGTEVATRDLRVPVPSILTAGQLVLQAW